jgi:hypothetical protein
VRKLTSLGLATLILLLALQGAAAAPPGYRSILTGRTAEGGSWALSADRSRLGGRPSVCLDLTATLADGTSPGGGGGCFSGSLRAGGNVAPAALSTRSGDTITSSLVGGIATYRARFARVKFANGKLLRIRTRLGPKGWRRALGTRIRFFAADALATTVARPRSVVLLDAKGRRVGGAPIGGPQSG